MVAIAETSRLIRRERASPAYAVMLGLTGAVAGGLVWFLAVTYLDHLGFVRPYLDALAMLVGAAAAYGAMYGWGGRRGLGVQVLAVGLTLPVLAVFQAFVVRLEFIRVLSELGYHGARIKLPLATYWDYVAWGLLSTSPPSLIFWAIAVGYAVAIPRRYGHD